MLPFIQRHRVARRGRTCALLSMVFVVACAVLESRSEPPLAPSLAAPLSGREPVRPIPLSVVLDARKVALGRELFHEPMLSGDRQVSCSSCHDLRKGGADGLNRGATFTIELPLTPSP